MLKAVESFFPVLSNVRTVVAICWRWFYVFQASLVYLRLTYQHTGMQSFPYSKHRNVDNGRNGPNLSTA